MQFSCDHFHPSSAESVDNPQLYTSLSGRIILTKQHSRRCCHNQSTSGTCFASGPNKAFSDVIFHILCRQRAVAAHAKLLQAPANVPAKNHVQLATTIDNNARIAIDGRFIRWPKRTREAAAHSTEHSSPLLSVTRLCSYCWHHDWPAPWHTKSVPPISRRKRTQTTNDSARVVFLQQN